MGNKKTLDLEPIITGLCYRKTETLTETEIRQAIAEAMLNFGVEYVTVLPTGDNIKQKVYIMPDTTQSSGNFGDIYVYDFTNTKWIHVDALKFNIADYVLISNIVNNLTDTSTNKPLSANQGKVLKALVDELYDTKVNINDIKNNLTSTDTNKPLSANQGTILKALVDGKAASDHSHGNLQNNGQVGSTAKANYNVVTDANGKITTEQKPTIPVASTSTPSADVDNGAIGSSSQYAKADHKHPLSSAYATAIHNQNLSTISDVTTVAINITFTDSSTTTLNLVKYTGS